MDSLPTSSVRLVYSSCPVVKGRIFATVAMAAFGVASIYFGTSARRWSLDFQQWIDAKPMEMTIDLTAQSTQSAPFKQTCAMAHGQSIYVAFDDPDANEENIGKHFAGLQGTVIIRDLSGSEILAKPFEASDVRLWGDDPMLVGFHPFKNGDYIAEIHIEQGAASLGAKQHELYARNELCGLELMPAYVLGAVSAVAGFIACVIGCYTLPAIAHNGFRAQRPH